MKASVHNTEHSKQGTTPRAILDNDHLRFANNRIEVQFDKRTGRWLSLVDRNNIGTVLDNGGNIAPVQLTAGGKTTWATGRNHLWSIIDTKTFGQETKLVCWRTRTERGVTWLSLDTKDGPWAIQHRFGLKANQASLQRAVRITWNGAAETLLRWIEFRTPVRTQLDDVVLEAPGYPRVLHQKLADLPLGLWDRLNDVPDKDVPAWHMGLAVLRKEDFSMLHWFHNQEMPSFLMVRKGEWGVWFVQKILSSCRMKPGMSLDIGTQHIRLHQGEFTEALAGIRSFWNSVGLVKKEKETAGWVTNARIYEAHIGTKNFPKAQPYAPYPQVKDLICDLGRIKELGFNIIELMPHMPYPSYSIHDYHDVTTHYGPENEIREMIQAAHACGAKVLFDVIMHGVVDNAPKKLPPHPYLEKHPEWFSKTEDGAFARTYTVAFDHANKSFSDFIVDVFSYYVRELDVDGFRVDALTWNSFPNWAPNLPYPGFSSFYGSARIFDRVRTAIRKIKPEILLYTETMGPLFGRSYDLLYNYDEQWIYELQPIVSKRGYGQNLPPTRTFSAREVAEWLAYRDLAMPDRYLKAHHVDSHDTHEGGGLGMFRREAFGPEAQRMFFALAAFCRGGIMNYAGGEAGSEAFYKTVLGFKESLAALREGSCDYLALQPSDNRLFTPLRHSEGMWAVPICSFTPEPVTAEIDLSVLNLAQPIAAKEMFTNEHRTLAKASLSVAVQGYGVQLWVIEK